MKSYLEDKSLAEPHLAGSGSFCRARHFGYALIPMWLGVAYLFFKDLLRAKAEPDLGRAVSSLGSIDTSTWGHIFCFGLFLFGVGSGLYLLKIIAKVESFEPK
jgi:hypothetical protein